MNITRIPFRDFIDQIDEFHDGFDMKLFLDVLRASKITFGMWYDEEFTKHQNIYIEQLKIQNHNIVILDDGYNVEEIVAVGSFPISHMIIDIENVNYLYHLVNRIFNLKVFL